MTVYRDGPKMRVETTLASRARATIVFDQATNAAYVLNAIAPEAAAPTAPHAPATLTPANTAAPAPAPAGASNTSVAPPPSLGFAVRVADADAPKPLEASWDALGEENAVSEGNCTAAGENGHLWRPRQTSRGAERKACITDDGIVVRLSEGAAVLFEATRVERGPQVPALFGIPSGYRVIDPAAVAAEVSGTMGPLGSVTGATPSAAQALTVPASPPSN